MSDHSKPLGRNKPPDTVHIEKYPLTALEAPPTKVPVPVGVNWYSAFDRPAQGTDGRWRVTLGSTGGTVRGGHCFSFEPPGEPDTERNWTFYDQGSEGACEGFGHARAMTLMKGQLLDAWWLYDDARRDEGTYPEGEGATNRHACAALAKWGVHTVKAEYPGGPPAVIERVAWKENVPGFEVASYHWASTVEQVIASLGFPSTANELPFLNSWGRGGYEHRVWMPVDVLARLLSEEGEASVLVPR